MNTDKTFIKGRASVLRKHNKSLWYRETDVWPENNDNHIYH